MVATGAAEREGRGWSLEFGVGRRWIGGWLGELLGLMVFGTRMWRSLVEELS